MALRDENPWDGILASTMFTIRATVHTTMQYTMAQLVFGRNSILNTRHKANWKLIKKRKQDLINKRNQQENRNGKEYTYNKGDKDLLKIAWKTKFKQDVRNNSTVRAYKRKVTDIFNIRNITPYKE